MHKAEIAAATAEQHAQKDTPPTLQRAQSRAEHKRKHLMLVPQSSMHPEQQQARDYARNKS